MTYIPVGWKDLPDTTTPINAANLNHMDGQYDAAMADIGAFINSTSGMLASQNGILYDGTNEGGKLDALLDTAATFGANVVLDRNRTLYSSTVITPPSGTRLNLNGATISVLAAGATGFRVITVDSVSNVMIWGGTIDGRLDLFAPATEQRHNISIRNSNRVRLWDITTKNAKGDGVYVGDQNGLSTDVFLQNILSDGNYRQGMSVSHVSGLLAINCIFQNTAGTDPRAGVDIEPNVGNVVCENIKFFGCTFSGNANFGFLVAIQTSPTVRQGDITLVGCDIVGNGANGSGGGIRLIGVTDFSMFGGSIRGNTGPGIVNNGASLSTNVNFEAVAVELNTQHGFAVTYPITGLTISACSIRNNSQQASGSFDGINLTPSAAMANPKILGNSFTGAHRYGVTTGGNISALQLIGNDYSGFITGATNLLDDASTRTELDGGTNNSIGSRLFIYGAAASSSPGLSVRRSGDTADRMNVLADGRITWSDGTNATDLVLSRAAAGVMALNGAFRTASYTTAGRPAAATVGAGGMIYDSTLSKPVWSNGTVYKDAAGTTV